MGQVDHGTPHGAAHHGVVDHGTPHGAAHHGVVDHGTVPHGAATPWSTTPWAFRHGQDHLTMGNLGNHASPWSDIPMAEPMVILVRNVFNSAYYLLFLMQTPQKEWQGTCST